MIVPAMLKEMRGTFTNYSGDTYNRLAQKVFYLDDANDMQQFIKGDTKQILIPGTNRHVMYDSMARVGFGFSQIGTSKAIALGAYNFALNKLDSK